MALVPQTKQNKIWHVMQYVSSQSGKVSKAVREELNKEGKLDATYVGGLDAQAKQDASDIIAMLRWLVDDLGVSVPSAFTDGEVDAINELIRQFDDDPEV